MMPQKAVPQAPALRLPSWKLGRLIVSWNESGQSCTHTPTQSLLVLRNSPSISPAAQGNTLTVILGACHLPHIHSTVSSTILSLHTLQMSLHPRPTTSLPHSEFCSLLIDLPASTFVPTSLLGQPEEFLKSVNHSSSFLQKQWPPKNKTSATNPVLFGCHHCYSILY